MEGLSLFENLIIFNELYMVSNYDIKLVMARRPPDQRKIKGSNYEFRRIAIFLSFDWF